MPKIRYVSKDFRQKSLDVITQAEAICDEYAARGFVLTLRQLYYQFVARDLLPNTTQSYDNLGSLINDARLAGLIDWQHLEDRTRNAEDVLFTLALECGVEDVTARMDGWRHGMAFALARPDAAQAFAAAVRRESIEGLAASPIGQLRTREQIAGDLDGKEAHLADLAVFYWSMLDAQHHTQQ